MPVFAWKLGGIRHHETTFLSHNFVQISPRLHPKRDAKNTNSSRKVIHFSF